VIKDEILLRSIDIIQITNNHNTILPGLVGHNKDNKPMHNKNPIQLHDELDINPVALNLLAAVPLL